MAAFSSSISSALTDRVSRRLTESMLVILASIF
jgi:hypothetical protein